MIISKSYSDYDRHAPLTPWGKTQNATYFMEGFMQVSTAGHGGVRVGKPVSQKIPELFRRYATQNNNGWYEEDCASAIPFYFGHDLLKEAVLSAENRVAHLGEKYMNAEWFEKFSKDYFAAQIKRYYPALWELAMNETVDLEGTYCNRESADAEKGRIITLEMQRKAQKVAA